MNIIYASVQCSEQYFSNLFGLEEKKPGQQVQKYNRLLAEGLASIKNVTLKAVTSAPVTEKNFKKRYVGYSSETVNNIEYHYLPMFNFHGFRDIITVFTSLFWIMHLLKKNKDSIIIYDVLNAPVALGALLAGKRRKAKCVGIVTDIPELIHKNSRSFYCRTSNYVIRHSTAYIFLTEEMNSLLNSENKKFVVIEGIADKKMLHKPPISEQKYNKKICMYTGTLHRKYGIDYLTEAFIKAGIEDAELHIYGDGDYEDELKIICKKVKNVKFYGAQMNEKVVKEQQKATLLINPRPTKEEFTKYSFPSKNMEYMVSGTPVLTTRLDGVPKEYAPYLYFIEIETVEGLTNTLLDILNKPTDELRDKGKKAREFVLNNKNQELQAQKVYNEILI